jgi:hypothetical protein
VLALEARRFVQALDDCRDAAVLSGAPAGIRIARSGYAMERFRRQWQALPAADAAPHALPAEITLSVATSARPGKAAVPPAVVCLPTGEIGLPAVRLSHRQRAGYYEFRDGADGEIRAAWIEPRA